MSAALYPVPPAGLPCDFDQHGFWVFGYGSLMWRPGFEPVENRAALLRGYHRALCVHSIRYRGTWERPGLVVGLDRGGACRGRALRVAPRDAEKVLKDLWDREMPTDSYVPKWLSVQLENAPERVCALAFVVNNANPTQYAAKLSADEIVARVVQGRGIMGSALDYLANTVRHLDDMGISEGALHDVLALAQRRAVSAAACAAGEQTCVAGEQGLASENERTGPNDGSDALKAAGPDTI
ncbi:MAG: gamma-glutamylcyclotransferase [Proteobacteria bacterium]|nr:gamma-glutamylcyclotransferase [Pseudomonadota bacterium]